MSHFHFIAMLFTFLFVTLTSAFSLSPSSLYSLILENPGDSGNLEVVKLAQLEYKTDSWTLNSLNSESDILPGNYCVSLAEANSGEVVVPCFNYGNFAHLPVTGVLSLIRNNGKDFSYSSISLLRTIQAPSSAETPSKSAGLKILDKECYVIPSPIIEDTTRTAEKQQAVGTNANSDDNKDGEENFFSNTYTYLLDTCSGQAHQKYRMVHVARIYDNATHFLITMSQISKDTALVNPVIISKSAYEVSYSSVINLMKQRNDSTYMGFALYGYWVLIFTLSTVINVAYWCCPYASEKIAKTPPINWLRRHLICPQVIRPSQLSRFKAPTEKSSQTGASKFNLSVIESMYRMPVRVHALLLFLYACIVTILCCVDYTFVTPNTIFRCPKGQKFVYYADRTGIIGTMQLPLIFLFASRNNPLTKITGLPYRTFQVYHKWVSRITFVLLLLHCTFYLSYVQARGDYIARWGLLKWRMANTAFIAICVTTAWGSVRRRYYEWFKSSHKILLVIFVIGAWYHCLTLGWIEYIAVSFSIWAADYIFRIAKITSTGGDLKANCRVLYETREEGEGSTKIRKMPHSIRMEVNHSGWWKPFPGAYCWVYFLKWNMFWEAHPFTVVQTTTQHNFNQLVFIVRVKKGLTRKLANFIAKQPNSQCIMSILVEGPYGTNIPFKAYDHAVFVAGGVGMTVVYSIAMDLAQIYTAQVLRGQKKSSEKSISIEWMIPSFESVTAFRQEIEKLRQFEDILKLHIFITREPKDPALKEVLNRLERPISKANSKPNEPISQKTMFRDPTIIELEPMLSIHENPEDQSGSTGRGSGNNFQDDEMVEFLEDLLNRNGNSSVSIDFDEKPDLTTSLHKIYTLAGPTAVIACGPPTLNADVRVVTVECLKRNRSVEYFEQELLW
ncbi:hypothetical protein FOA43_000986 [Brettanomyces nanus]|uniref:FAD-binding FR-type domain-containing protein n=1 Tax=Eeniella nana TaxID=13502 RepID=A0A875RYH3_EENNA|nr:uncharacterized protein FOA43_000986 [Brettanomyces nanus]QPG73673.1 hypothetical protein FOA43_000986 [Brettanomyces nanus]